MRKNKIWRQAQGGDNYSGDDDKSIPDNNIIVYSSYKQDFRLTQKVIPIIKWLAGISSISSSSSEKVEFRGRGVGEG